MMSYTTQQSNGDMSLQERTSSAVQFGMEKLVQKKRKRDTTDQGGGEARPGSKRGSKTNNVNGNGHEPNMFLDNMPDSSGSTDFSALAHHLQSASANHGIPPVSNASSTAAQALAAGIMPQMTIPQPTEMSFASTGSGTDADRHLDSSFDMGGDNGAHHSQGAPYNLNSFPNNTAAQVQSARESSVGGGLGGNKPSVGSEEWHKVRRDNHKEVERRRRETINEGINELAKIVPHCEKNKGSILQRAVEWINTLTSNEQVHREQWVREKSGMEGLLHELTGSVEGMRKELDRVHKELVMWRKTAQDAGLEPRLDYDGVADAEAEGDTDT